MNRLQVIKKKLDALLKTHNVAWGELSALYSEKRHQEKPSGQGSGKGSTNQPSEGQKPADKADNSQNPKK